MIETQTVLHRKSTPFVHLSRATPGRNTGLAAERFVHLDPKAAIHTFNTGGFR